MFILTLKYLSYTRETIYQNLKQKEHVFHYYVLSLLDCDVDPGPKLRYLSKLIGYACVCIDVIYFNVNYLSIMDI